MGQQDRPHYSLLHGLPKMAPIVQSQSHCILQHALKPRYILQSYAEAVGLVGLKTSYGSLHESWCMYWQPPLTRNPGGSDKWNPLTLDLTLSGAHNCKSPNVHLLSRSALGSGYTLIPFPQQDIVTLTNTWNTTMAHISMDTQTGGSEK